VLGVDAGATPDEVHDAFRRRAREVHPDATRGDGAGMVELNEAYRVMSSPREPDWEFADRRSARPDSDAVVDPDPEPSADEPSGRSPFRWFGIAVAVAAAIWTAIVFVAAIGYDWSLSP
jgi:curved DNA-binding protein CbpA